MRVLHAVHTSLPFLCGYSIRSGCILRCQRDAGLEVAVVSSAQHPNGEALQEEIEGVPHWRTVPPSGRQLPLVREWRLMRALERRLEEVAREWRPDLIHAHSPMLVGIPALRVARRLGVPLVYEVRDLWENASVDRGKFREGSPQYRAARAAETYVLRRADAAVTICEKLREELAPRVGRPDRLFVVGNGVDLAQFDRPADGDAARERRGLVGKRVIGYIGTFQPYEGLGLLIEVMPDVLKAVPEARLLIVGAGGEEERLKALARERKLDAAVTFTGRVPHEEVASLYAAADLLVYPRVLTRTTALTTPLKPLEAMAMRKPVLVSDVPAMAELVQPGVTGLSFRAGDREELARRVVELLKDADLRDRLGLGGREWIERERQWPRLVREYRRVYACRENGGAAELAWT